ncbi:hypothetical protein [Salinivibrio kushneri]|nr:hypothetical protein [Salinivibrio kushneri]
MNFVHSQSNKSVPSSSIGDLVLSEVVRVTGGSAQIATFINKLSTIKGFKAASVITTDGFDDKNISKLFELEFEGIRIPEKKLEKIAIEAGLILELSAGPRAWL